MLGSREGLAARGAPVRIAISAERDKYVAHHRGLGGTAWVHLADARRRELGEPLLRSSTGSNALLTREEAARRFNLMARRIGDLVVLGDRDTVFGALDTRRTRCPGLSHPRVGA